MITIPETLINAIKALVEKADYSFSYDISAHENGDNSNIIIDIRISKNSNN